MSKYAIAVGNYYRTAKPITCGSRTFTIGCKFIVTGIHDQRYIMAKPDGDVDASGTVRLMPLEFRQMFAPAEPTGVLDSASIAATILKQRNRYAPHWDPNLFRAMDDSAYAFADALLLNKNERDIFLRACGVQP